MPPIGKSEWKREEERRAFSDKDKRAAKSFLIRLLAAAFLFGFIIGLAF